MKLFSAYIKRHIAQNRRSYLLLVIKTYGVNYQGLWRALGYCSLQEYEQDIAQVLEADLRQHKDNNIVKS
ncbi:hypothetical protein [Psychromonas aquimarina]|uniref:hypothetical protein n=1 Tax=Psychromonas aquimarina TaxID=444919 RepID=UPI0003FFEE3D|nr:hypothetical protein [Psychromonas aquimarina]